MTNDRKSDNYLDTAETMITPATGVTQSGDSPESMQGSETVITKAPGSTQQVDGGQQIRFGRFVAEGTIGKGGMGVVYKAVDPLIGRTVAIKALRTDHGGGGDSQSELQSRFELEFKSAGTLSHPNIVTIYDVGQENDTTFIAMEYIEGRSLEQLLREGEVLSFDRIGELVTGICAGLDFAHDAGIVHRDVKPANILIDPAKGIPKITDFGVAKVQSSGLTQTGTVIGTPAYMSPEQILGKEVSGRSDQFSAAVILYQMLTGELPFGSDSPASILFRIVHSEPTPPHEINEDLPPEISAAIAKAMAKDPADRYESCVDMAEATSLALTGQAPTILENVDNLEGASFKSVTLSTTEPLRGSGTYAGAASWWQRQSGGPKVGLAVAGAVLVAAAGWFAMTQLGKGDDSQQASNTEQTASGLEADDPPASATNPATGVVAAAGGGPAATDVETPKAPVMRQFTIDSKPQGAEVRVAGEPLDGVTPLRNIELEVGKEYEFLVTLDGYRNAGGTFTIEADRRELIYFPLTVDTKPGSITIDKPEGYGNITLMTAGRRIDPNRVMPGSYEITVQSPSNYFTSEPYRVEILEGKAASIRLPPLKKVRLVAVGGADPVVRIDNGPEFTLLPADVWLRPQSTHRFSFTFDNGETVQRQLRIGTTVGRVIGSPDEIQTRR